MRKTNAPHSGCSRSPRRSGRGGPSPGLYSQYFTAAEREMLDLFAEDKGVSELNLLRVLLARTFAVSRRRIGLDLHLHAALLAASSQTAANIAVLARLRLQILTPFDDPLLEAMAADDVDDL